MRKLLTLALLAASGLSQAADTRYVTDQLEATIRTGESVTHRITKMLPTGTAVEVLSTNPKSGYSRIRMQDGKDGYIHAPAHGRGPAA